MPSCEARSCATTSSRRTTEPPSKGRPQVLQRQVSIGVQVEIVDLVENVILWESRGLVAQGEFLESSESEEVGRLEAIELLVQKIVDGAQSNW